VSKLVWFDIPAQDAERAKSFYASVFGWCFEGLKDRDDCWLIADGDADKIPASLVTGRPQLRGITNYLSVTVLSEAIERIKVSGGRVLQGRMELPGYGVYAICEDTEGNQFSIWEKAENATCVTEADLKRKDAEC